MVIHTKAAKSSLPPNLRAASEARQDLGNEGIPADSISIVDARLLHILSTVAADIRRIADVLDPAPPDIVGTPYVAKKLGITTTTWIADMVRRGDIPRACIVPGTGNGKVWKFYRAQIDEWIASR